MSKRARPVPFLPAVLAASILAGTPVPGAVAQELAFRTVARTGVHGLYAGHSVHLNVVELGGARVEPTEVRLRILDGDGRVLGRLVGTLEPGAPLRLSVSRRGRDAKPTLVRAEATLTTPGANLAASRPVVTLELVNDITLDTVPAATCPIAYDPRGQGPILSCECDLVGDFTS